MALHKSNVLQLAQREGDFKDVVFKLLAKELKQTKIPGEKLLIVTYIPPEKTKGGIILSNRALDENRFQGKVALIVKIGDEAFKYKNQFDHEGLYDGHTPKVGDYVVCRFSDGFEMLINGTAVRLIDQHAIQMYIEDPESVY